MLGSSGSQSPPSLHHSPSVGDHDRASTRDSTPVTTPLGFGVPSSHRPDREKDYLDTFWSRKLVDSGHHRSYFDPQIPSSHLDADQDFPLFLSPPTSNNTMTGPAAPIDIAARQTSVSPPGQQASNLTSALQKANNGERTGSISHSNGVGLSVFKAPPPRKDSFNTAAGQWGNGTKPISVTGSNRDKQRRESLAGSLVGGMSWGGVSVGSWIRDE